MRFPVAFAVFCLAILGCPPAAVTPPPDASDSGPKPVPVVDAAPPAPAPAPPATADTGSPVTDPTGCEAACATLAKLGCPEGFANPFADAGGGIAPLCTPTCQKTQAAKVTDLKPACLAAATSVTQVQACGTVRCLIDASKSGKTKPKAH